jgi:hypothetical protein
MSRKKAKTLDATAEIESEPEFHAEILRNKRALDRGKGRLDMLSSLFKDKSPRAKTVNGSALESRLIAARSRRARRARFRR